MCQRSGTFLLAAVLVGLGVINCAYPSEVQRKTLKHYSTHVPFITSLHLNAVLGLLMMLAAVALVMQKCHASCLIQTVAVLNIALQGFPYASGLELSEQFGAAITLVKSVAIIGASLLVAK